MSLKRTLDMPAEEAFLDFVKSSAAAGDCHGRADVQEVRRTEADMRAAAEETLSSSWEPKAKRHARDVLALLERLSKADEPR
jgi:hypothetical protein